MRTESTWAVLLAGGEGSRLRGQTIAGTHIDRPKQFVPLNGGASLLAAALKRALGLVPRSRVVVVVASAHRPWWTGELRGILPENILVQPVNRGTAPALLLATAHILNRDPDATMVVLPSDHGVEEEFVLSRTLSAALRVVADLRHDLVLVGVTPTHPETEYGWIVPETRGPGVAHAVREFVEKPCHEKAVELMEHGALWNTFMFVASTAGLLDRFLETAPSFARHYLGELSRNGSTETDLGRFYPSLQPRDFSRDLLAASSGGLGVIGLPPCGWTDLGTPRRVAAWLARQPVARDLAMACG